MLGPQAIIGATVRSEADAAALAPDATDYVCIGGVFTTSSKDNPDPPIGVAGFAALARLVRRRAPGIPVGAIAGITERNAAEVIRAGADGVAVISAVTTTRDPEGAARKLRAIIDTAKLERGAA
jgi:thiamine-phosphate pyrophosphorylase